MSIEILSSNNLQRFYERTDIEQFLLVSARDPSEALSLGSTIIKDRDQFSKALTHQCAADIAIVWKQVQANADQQPAILTLTRKWQQDILGEIDVQHYLDLAASTIEKVGQHFKHIKDSWGVQPKLALPKEILPPEGLSKSLLQRLAELAKCTPLDKSRILLQESISLRTGQYTRAARTRTTPYLTTSDVSAAIQQRKGHTGAMAQARKRGRDLLEDGEAGSKKKGKPSSAVTQSGQPPTRDRSQPSPVILSTALVETDDDITDQQVGKNDHHSGLERQNGHGDPEKDYEQATKGDGQKARENGFKKDDKGIQDQEYADSELTVSRRKSEDIHWSSKGLMSS